MKSLTEQSKSGSSSSLVSNGSHGKLLRKEIGGKVKLYLVAPCSCCAKRNDLQFEGIVPGFQKIRSSYSFSCTGCGSTKNLFGNDSRLNFEIRRELNQYASQNKVVPLESVF
ncbi:hypothetical protein HN832_00465 [archaeon]|nr:hypothetical protein [archaeon]MBT4373715.1 hypothetical protein [archaeon]MBT4531769.1 hypothetical protein [archaeon]MBT7001881.1 hypothetical protein [archaeon]MBT7281866.1 hypothetical protein [archaeon]